MVPLKWCGAGGLFWAEAGLSFFFFLPKKPFRLMTIDEYRAESQGWAWWDFKSASRNGPKMARLHNAGFRCLMFVYRMTYSYRCFIPIPVLVSDAFKNWMWVWLPWFSRFLNNGFKVKCRLNVVSSAKSSIVTTFRSKVPDHKNDSRVREGLNNIRTWQWRETNNVAHAYCLALRVRNPELNLKPSRHFCFFICSATNVSLKSRDPDPEDQLKTD